MPAMLHRLLYVSTADPDMRNDVLEHLLDTAERRNAALNITGLLVFTGTHFMQLLEGPKDAVEAVFDMICQDRRHSAIARLIAEPVQERSCPDWSMALRVVEAANDGPNQIFTVDDQALESFLPDAMAPDLRVLFQSFNTMKRATHVAAE
ncbi:BLUF domain-containing protein [Maricaulaceae bacterium NA33B04]|nr:BLUF domain-containing protein [Maricaulaceae bacterium NA33B04]